MNTNFKTWKTIKVDYNKELRDYNIELKNSLILTNQFPELCNVSFEKRDLTAMIQLVKIDIHELEKLGTSLSKSNDKIISHLYGLGLQNCDIQTALQFGILFKQKREKEIIKIMTEPVLTNNQRLQFIQFKNLGKHYLSLVDTQNLNLNYSVPTYLVFKI